MLNSRKAAVVACAAATVCWVAASDASAHLHFVDYSMFPEGEAIPDGTLLAHQFMMWGAMYDHSMDHMGSHIMVRQNGMAAISPTAVGVLMNMSDMMMAPTVRMSFVMHMTEMPSVADFIAVTPTNSMAAGTIFTMTAWDTEDQVLASVSTEVEPTDMYDAMEDPELVIFSQNIAYVTFHATAPMGSMIAVEIDNMRYNHIMPAPGVVGAGLMGMVMVSRRRR